MTKEQNEQMVAGFVESLQTFKSALHSSIQAFNHRNNNHNQKDYFYHKYNVTTAYVRNFTSISSDLNAMNVSFNFKIPFFTKPQPDISDWLSTINDIYFGVAAFLDINIQSNFSGLVMRLLSCIEKSNKNENSSACIDNDPNAPNYLYYKRNILEKWEHYAVQTLKWLNTMDSDYHHAVRLLFEHTDVDYEKIEDHVTCISTLNYLTLFWKPLLYELVHKYRPLYLSSQQFKVKLEVAKVFEDFHRLSAGDNQISKAKVKQLF